MIKLILSTLFLAITCFIYGQHSDTIDKTANLIKYDTSRIVDLSNKLAIYFNVSGKINNVDIQSKTSEKQLQLVPNNNVSIGLGVDYKWIGLGVSVNIPNSNQDIYGTTEYYDLQLNYYRNSFVIDAYLKYYKGFYLSNPDEFTDWTSQIFPLLPGMETFATGISAYYVFNHKKFSYKAAFPRTMWQKKSAGSWILGAYASLNACVAPGGVVPPELPDSLVTNYDIDEFSNTAAGIAFGYTYTWVIRKKFFVNITAAPGFGYSKPRISTSIEDKTFKPGVAASISSRVSIGYEGKHLYYGFNLVSMIDNFNYEKIQVSSTTGNLRLFIGRRFDVSKWFKKNKNVKI